MSHAVHKPLVFSLLITTGPFPWSEGGKPTLCVEVSWVLQVFIGRSPDMTANLSSKCLHLEQTALLITTTRGKTVTASIKISLPSAGKIASAIIFGGEKQSSVITSGWDQL